MKRLLFTIGLIGLVLGTVWAIPPFVFVKPPAGTIPPPPPPPENIAPGYSVRLLNTNYTGICMIVHTNDPDYTVGTVLNVGWMTNTAGLVLLDVPAIEAYAQGLNVHVRAWMDQGTNSEGTVYAGNSSTSEIHPMIASSGVVISNNGMPAIAWTNCTSGSPGWTFNDEDYWTETYDEGMSYEFNREYQVEFIGNGFQTGLVICALASNLGLNWSRADLTNHWGVYNGTPVSSGYAATGHQFFMLTSRNYDDIDFYTDNETVVTKTDGVSYQTYTGELFAFSANQFIFQGYIQEFIRFRYATNDVTTIKNSANAAFNVW